ncbi:MAG: ABC transporter ATP-binding protein, partial [Clostridiales bacterium]|nr:ABC transporter ATP-binding protein [Clostridiales bacterium]
MKKQKIQINTIRKVLGYIKEYRILLLLSIILATATVALTLYIPILIGNAIDHIIGPDNVNLEAIIQILVKVGV